MDLSIIIPVYNSFNRLEVFWRILSDALARIQISAEVIMVDDGSSDGSF